jgi:hypothetical protein
MSQKTTFFIVPAVKTSNLADLKDTIDGAYIRNESGKCVFEAQWI